MRLKRLLFVFLFTVLVFQAQSLSARNHAVKSGFDIENNSDFLKLDPTERAYFYVYMTKLQNQIKSNWHPKLGEKSMHAITLFDISPDGSVSNLKMIGKSGSFDFDRDCLQSIINTAPYPKVKRTVSIEFTFDYNLHKTTFWGTKKQVEDLYYDRSRPYNLEAYEKLVPVIERSEDETLRLKMSELPKAAPVDKTAGLENLTKVALDEKFSKVPEDFKVGMPIDCKLGKDCFVMAYPDQAAGDDLKDFACGRMSDDELKGTAFSLLHEVDMRKGVNVLASAAGEVLRARDGMPDKQVYDDKSVIGNECGNAIVIKHAKDWESQYCHLQLGSIGVKAGDKVKKGDLIAKAGESGASSFPQVLVIFRYKAQAIDPFTGTKIESGCGKPIADLKPLWETPIPYKGTGFVRSGVADLIPALDDSWAGKYLASEISGTAESLIAWVHTYGLLKDDIEEFEIYRPDGSLFTNYSRKREEPLRNALVVSGRKNSSPPFMAGEWKAVYKLIRGGIVLVDRVSSFTVK